jgi:hypothetical protein
LRAPAEVLRQVLHAGSGSDRGGVHEVRLSRRTNGILDSISKTV